MTLLPLIITTASSLHRHTSAWLDEGRQPDTGSAGRNPALYSCNLAIVDDGVDRAVQRVLPASLRRALGLGRRPASHANPLSAKSQRCPDEAALKDSGEANGCAQVEGLGLHPDTA